MFNHQRSENQNDILLSEDASAEFKILTNKKLMRVGFEPTLPKKLAPEASTLDQLGHLTIHFSIILKFLI
jgi:hypothetical protein